MAEPRDAVRSRRWRTAALAVVVLGVLVLAGLASLGVSPRSFSSMRSSHEVAAGPLAAAAPLRSPAVVSPSPAAASGGQNQSATASPAWLNVTNASAKAPPERSYGRSFAYDPVDHYLVMFGGDGDSGYLNDTWTYANGTWTQIHPKSAPDPRDHSTLAWDPVAGYLVLFGGSGASYTGDTWTFLHGNWTQLTEATHPSARWGSSLTWDAGDQEMVLFGGCAGSAVADTWTFSNGKWTELFPKIHPTGRENPALMYDAAINATILFGGDDYGGNYDSDTWEFKAGNWTEVNVTVHPSDRTEADLSYDAVTGNLVLFGGMGSAGVLGDTWLFANGTWTLDSLANPPPARYFGLMAYDNATARVVLWGGVGNTGDLVDTWAFVGFNMTATASVAAAVGPVRVGFTANASNGSGPYTYFWQFGDGNVSFEQNASNLYGTPGRYVATVRVTDAAGSFAVTSFAVRVMAPLAVSANVFPTSGVVPLTVTCALLASGGTQPYTVLWYSGAPGNSSTNATTNFVYGRAGSYTATAQVTDAGGVSWNESFTVDVTPRVIVPLTATVVASNVTGIAPFTVWFVATASGGLGPYTTAWSFGNGLTASGTAANTTYTSSGTFPATATITDAHGNQLERTLNVTVGPGLAAQANAPSTAVANQTQPFTASVSGGLAPYTIVWDFGDAHAAASADPSHAYSLPGQYTATFTVVDHRGYSVSQQFRVTVSAAPATGGGGGSGSSPTGASSNGGLSDAEVYGLAIVGGAAILGVALVVIRRMDR